MSVTLVLLFFPPNYETHIFSQSCERSSGFDKSSKIYYFRRKLLVNDLVETKDKDPYSTHTDVILNLNLSKTFSCMTTQDKVSNSCFKVHLWFTPNPHAFRGGEPRRHTHLQWRWGGPQACHIAK